MIDRDELINSWEIFRDKMISALTGKGKQIMLHREKVIKGLEHCDFGVSDTCYEKECPYYQSHDCTDELKNDILVLLKEQEPKTVIITHQNEYCKDGKCPSCGHELDDNMHPKYCGYCGQAVKWNE